jgi:hypothetical protein
MLRINRGGHFTLLKKTLKDEQNNVHPPCATPFLIAKRGSAKLKSYQDWEREHSRQLTDILHQFESVILSIDMKGLKIRINVDLWQQAMKKKVYDLSESRFKTYS